MGFSSKRGRPCLHRPEKDTGTRELAARHAEGHTMEALDICLKRNLISDEAHRAGLHLRWLYSLRFGAPTVRAYDHSNLGGSTLRKEHDPWRARREQEYEQAITQLKQINAANMVSNVAIFNRFPRFLLPPRTVGALARRTEISQEINLQELAKLQEGLALLQQLFERMRYSGGNKTQGRTAPNNAINSKGRTNPIIP